MKSCLTCPYRHRKSISTKDLINNVSKGTAKWLKKKKRSTAVPANAPLPSEYPLYPSKSTVEIKVKVKKKKGIVLFWGAAPKRITDPIVDAPTAYGKYYVNMGVTRVKDGWLRMRVMCPQPYKEEGVVFPPHIHYVYAKGDGDTWNDVVHTVAAFPGRHANIYKMKCIMDAKSKSTPFCTIISSSRLQRNWKKFRALIHALPMGADAQRTTLSKERNSIKIPYEYSNEKQMSRIYKEIGNYPYVVVSNNSETEMEASKLIARMIKGGCPNVYYAPDRPSNLDKWTK